MTFLAKDIRDHLANSTPIYDAFGDRIYPDGLPQDVRYTEAIVISDLSNEPEYYLGGESGTHTSIVQVDVWTDGTNGRARANALGELVRNRLSGYRGQFGGGCFGTSRMIRNNTVSERPFDGSDTRRWRVSMDFEIIHTAAVPTLT